MSDQESLSRPVKHVWFGDWPWLIAQAAMLLTVGVAVSLWRHSDLWSFGPISAALYVVTMRVARRDWIPPKQP